MKLLFLIISFSSLLNSQEDQDDLLFQKWNQVFKSELQLELQADEPALKSESGPPQDQGTPANRMKQILYEQEEMMEKIKARIAEEKERERLAAEEEADRLRRERNARWGQHDDDGDMSIYNKGAYTDDDPSRSGKSSIKKPLQREISEGVDESSKKTDAQIILESNLHKLAYIMLLMIILLTLILMREFYTNILKKYFRQALKRILLENTMITSTIFFWVILYYEGFFDQYYLALREGSARGVSGIRLVEYKNNQLIDRPSQIIFDEYLIDVYSYLMVVLAYFITMLCVHVYFILRFNFQTNLYEEAENQWDKRKELAGLYKKALEELHKREDVVKNLLTYPHPPAQVKILKEQIHEIKKCLIDVRFIIEFFCMKKQFLWNPSILYPYMGPCTLREDFRFSEYIGRISAKTVREFSHFSATILGILLLSVGFQGFLFWAIYKLWNSTAAAIILLIISYSIVVASNTKIHNALSYAYSQIILNADDHVEANKVLQDMDKRWYPPFLSDTYQQIFPTPEQFYANATSPQHLLFFRQSTSFMLFLISLTCKFMFTSGYFVMVYITCFFETNIWIILSLLIIIIGFTYWQVHIFIPKMIIKLVKAGNTEMMRDYDVIRLICSEHRKRVIEACQHFFEFMKYLERYHDRPEKECLVMHRKFLVETLLEALDQFQGQGDAIIIPPERPQPEQDLIDQGVNEKALGLHLPPTVIPDLVKLMGFNDMQGYEILYMINFCQVQPNYQQEGGGARAKQYISPLRLLLYIQLRTQEAMIPGVVILRQSILRVIKLILTPVKREEIPPLLIYGELTDKFEADKIFTAPQQKQPSKNQEPDDEEEEEEEEKEADPENPQEERKSDNDHVKQFVIDQFTKHAVVDIQNLESFLDKFCETNLYDPGLKDILINELYFLTKFTPLTMDRVVEFVINQIDLRPL